MVAAVTTLAPIVQVRAEEPAPVGRVTAQSFGVATIRLAEAAKSPLARQYPVEVLAAATDDFLGLPLEAIDRVTVMLEPPMGVSPQYALVLESSQPITLEKFRAEVTQGTTPGELLGRPLLEAQQELAPSLCLLDDNTLAVGPTLFLKRLISNRAGGPSELQELLSSEEGTENHVYAALSMKPLQPLIEVALVAAKQEMKPEHYRFLEAPRLIDKFVATADFGDERRSHATVFAVNDQAAYELEQLLAEGYALLRQEMLKEEEFSALRNHKEAVVRAWAAYCLRSMDEYAIALGKSRQNGNAFVLSEARPGDGQALMVSTMTIGVLVALLLPAVQAAREAARRTQSVNNLRQVALAMHVYHEKHNAFPPHAIYSADGKPLLSWRVALLPYLEEQALYDKFHLDEPWDSPHNMALLTEMPQVYADPSSTRPDGQGVADYLGVVGPKAAFGGGPKGRTFADFTDGMSRTVLIVQVNGEKGVEWTRPADYDAVANDANPMGGIRSLHPGVFLGGFADCSVRAIPLDTTAEILRALFTIDGGEDAELP